ncbi:MAG: UDP-N-acetylmuramate dehydrogenase [gamma proteobacterium symbiont of Bathyaustriella thionipta]|nr:UDP-N-acetylmuramate dehydrogenase [gamma proteobacterium symbiont of Bathyaustriella thionipta]MCU7949311.1 UDP-N-acetylmuramate dehydrogenase [gamma proteobacterium symbiont of Bathyaustriella thionipta]MCU7953385.1 UDP-N-acetylmuramate dehydrogenase [gamma proteobacterium symbiont of Bathyaustriella thionipta]MCU7955904.1 UDP-N-acetylmuramate dehydrogenase [gamma proteobacterium symbiont of Bathyaustriella thionipta]
MSALQNQLSEAQDSGKLQGQLRFEESLARYTTWRIGGKAECWYQPHNADDLQAVLKILPENTAVNWVGLGSNLLIRDGGVKGLIISTNGVLNKLAIQCADEYEQTSGRAKCLITAQAGVACAIFSRKAAHLGLNGAEFLSGIPGTIGGALAMNAGAFGGEIWRHVVSVTMINHHGELISRKPDEFIIQYRKVEARKAATINKGETPGQEWFLSGVFSFEKDVQGLKQSKLEIKRLLAKRAATQPTKQANAGSVFKNPDNDYAARLIESCGLKGKSINGAQISEKHANFIVNNGAATAKDVETLINEIKATVLKQHQIKLETEVRVIGEY